MLAGAATDANIHQKVLVPIPALNFCYLCWPKLVLKWSRQGVEPDFSEALIVRNNSSIEDVCDQIHRTLKETFKYALVWGASAKHIPQRVGLSHMVADEDVVSIVSAWKA